MAERQRKPKTKSIEIDPSLWDAMAVEYASTDTSYRQLASKYSVSYNRIQTYAKEHGWLKQKDVFMADTVDKSLEILSNQKAERIARAINIGDSLLDKIEESLNELNKVLCKTTTTIRTYEKDEEGNTTDKSVSKEDFNVKEIGMIDRSAIKQLTSALKDLREIGIFRSELDRREQEARINKLQKDAEEEVKDTTITVQIASDADEYGD